jgi:hypothetical protein
MVDALFTVYHLRATQLADAMKLCRDDLSSFASASALLAVHSAISYSDAVLIGLGGKRSRSEDHRDAITHLKRACSRARIEPLGIAQLQKLLSAKTDVSYGEKRIENEQIAALCFAAERFQAWAERTLKDREGRASS